MTARLLLSTFFALFIFFFSSLTPAFAQTPAKQTNPYTMTNTNPDVPQDMHYFIQSVFLELGSAIVCQLSGVDPINSEGKCLGVDPTTGKIGFVQNGGGAIGMMGNMIASLYNPPVRTNDFIAYMGQNFGVSKPAYAQTTSIQSLSPVLNLWVTFRDLVYLIFVVAFVVVGFAIMLRVKIDPRTVMSIENQIPKLIAGLVLVTLSYAIAGLLIDMMWVSTHVIVNVLVASDKGRISTAKVNNNLNNPPLQFANDVLARKSNAGAFGGIVGTGGSAGGILDMSYDAGLNLQGIISNIFTPQDFGDRLKLAAKEDAKRDCPWYLWLQPTVAVGCRIAGTTGAIASQFIGWLVGWIVSILAMVVIAIAIFVALMRTWIALLKAYIFLLLDVALSPFWIVSGAIPGGPGIGGWFKDILANLTAFPTTVAFLLLGRVFSDQFAATSVANPFAPPFVGTPDPRNLGTLVGLGFILMTPVVLERVRKAFGAPDLDLSPIGSAIGAGMGVLGNMKGQITNAAWGTHYHTDSAGHTSMVASGGPVGNFARRMGWVGSGSGGH